MPEQVCIECVLESCITCEHPNAETLACCCGGSHFESLKTFTFPVSISDGGILPDTAAKGPSHHSPLHALQEILEQTPGRGRPRLSDDELSDPLKGGRLRAQREFPIPEGTKCEWANLLYAGGGVNPIVGCMGSTATARHHGPDKSTLNNDKENVHLVCNVCHNRWHTMNDKFYPDQRPDDGLPFVPENAFLSHDPDTTAEPEDLFDNEIWWTTRADKRKTEMPPNLEKKLALDNQ